MEQQIWEIGKEFMEWTTWLIDCPITEIILYL